MVLIDEAVYDKKPNDKIWKRSGTDVTKTNLYDSMHSQLDSIAEPDDVKAKHYQQTLKRFLNLKQQVPELQSVPLNGSLLLNSVETPPQKIKKPNRKKQVKRLLGPLKATKRKHIPWSRYDE